MKKSMNLMGEKRKYAKIVLFGILLSHGLVYSQKYMEHIFTDVTEESNLSSFGYPIHYATWVDFDNDQNLDVFVTSPEAQNALYKNRGDGTFINVIKESGIPASGYVFESMA